MSVLSVSLTVSQSVVSMLGSEIERSSGHQSHWLNAADANLADEGTHTGQGTSSRTVSDGPSRSGHDVAAANKRVKRPRSKTPEGGLSAHQYVWDDPDQMQPKLEPRDWQGFATGNVQGLTESADDEKPHNSHKFLAERTQGQSQSNQVSTKKRTGLKVKLNFKNG